jgi:serine/threonine-protein kinase
MKQIKFIGAVIIIAIMASCDQAKQNNAQNEIPNDWKTFEHKDYSIQFPDSFEYKTSEKMGAIVIFFPKDTSSTYNFTANINLMIQDLQGLNISLDDFVKRSEYQIETMITNGNLIESERINKNSFEFHRLAYTGTQGKLTLRFEQHFTIKNEKAYILTFTTEDDHFDNYKTVGKEIMDSFKIK